MATLKELASLGDLPDKNGTFIIETFAALSARVEAMEQRQAPEPAPAPAADRPLWDNAYAVELEAMADWLDCHGRHYSAAAALRTEARRAREGA